MNDTISRQAALDALDKRFDSIPMEQTTEILQLRRDLRNLPSAQPTLYGYDIKHLAFVASIMAKKGVSPEEAVTIFRDVNRVIEMMLEDMKEMQENALKQALKKPCEGGQDGKN